MNEKFSIPDSCNEKIVYTVSIFAKVKCYEEKVRMFLYWRSPTIVFTLQSFIEPWRKHGIVNGENLYSALK